MFPQPKDSGYTEGLNQLLLDAVPEDAMVVVETGCAEGMLGAELKRRVPGRTVIGIEIEEDVAAQARTRLDEVIVHDLMTGPPPVEAGSVDVVLFGDVLEHIVNPEQVLVDTRKLLAPGGRVLASIPNVGHHSVLRPLLRGDFMYQPQGQLDATHLRFFTYATIWKLFLDAGYVPTIIAIADVPIPDSLHTALTPALLHHRVDPERARTHLGAYQYIVEAVPAPAPPAGFAPAMTFACLVNDGAQLQSNLLRSPPLAAGSPHQVIELPGCTSAAEGLNIALQRAEHDIVVLVQQDMYLPRGWDHAFRASWDAARAQFGDIGVAGLFGFRYRDGNPPSHVGRIIDRDRLLDEATELPAQVDSVDEVLLALPKDTPLRLDPKLGFHLYGADLALQARQLGLSAVVLDALSLHNSLFARLDAQFHASRTYLLDKWSTLRPLHTNMGALDVLEFTPGPTPWHTQLRQDLANVTSSLSGRDNAFQASQRELADLRAQLASVTKQLGKTRRRLDRIEGSRTWRARRAADKVVRRLRHASQR